jgi:CO/xanthine dehydrogenase FAD-binding subunit
MKYYRPTSLAEAIAIRRNEDVALLAGATDIYPAYVGRKAWGHPTHKDILDLSAVPSLRAIDIGEHEVRLGALVSWGHLARANLSPQFDGIRAAAREIGGQQIQNRGTIVGNACTASPAGDGIPNLLALDAVFEIAGPSPRLVSAQNFFKGYRQVDCRADEIVTGIIFPHREARSAFMKLGARRYLVISIAMVAAVIETTDSERIAAARIAVGACSAVARRLTGLEEDLVGLQLTDASARVGLEHFASLQPIDDLRASAAYRQDAALTLVQDVLAAIPARRVS